MGRTSGPYKDRTFPPDNPAAKNGVTKDLYRWRIKQGWKPPRIYEPPEARVKNRYNITDEELEQAAKVELSYENVRGRLAIGWTREEALTVPKGVGRPGVIRGAPKDRAQRKVSLKNVATARKNGIKRQTLDYRRRQGMPMELATTLPPNTKAERVLSDSDLADAIDVNLNYKTLKTRLDQLKWSLKKALKTPVRERPKKKFLSKYELAMLKDNGICISTYHTRRRRGWLKNRALTERPMDPTERANG